MLKQFSRLEKTRSFVILLFAGLLILGLVVAGVYNRTGVATANPFRSKEVLATVKGEDVTVAEFTVRKKIYEQRTGGQFSLAQMGMTGERLLDSLVNDRIVVQEAERLDLLPADEEVREEIRRQAAGPAGAFDLKSYKDAVVRNFGSVQLYEQGIRDGLALRKLQAYVTTGVQVSEDEVRREFERNYTSYDLVYAPVTAAELAKKLTASDEELRQYFNEHKDTYRFNEPQKKIRYLFVNQEKAGSKLSITDEELRKEYDSLKPENKMSGVRVQQIVIRVPRPELDQEILNKASGIVARIRQEDLTATEEAFAESARGNSEDPATAQNGGWLPNPVRRALNRKPNAGAPGNVTELLQNTLDWKEGQVGDPLRTGNAYYIFRRGPIIPKTFEEARPELLASLRNRRSYGVAQQLAQRAEERLKETKDVQRVAQELAAEANMTPAEMVKETPFVKPGDDVPDIGSSPQFEDVVKPLEEPGQVGARVGVKNGFAVPLLVEKRDPRVPDFEEVRERVSNDFRNERARQQLEQTARELASNTPGAAELKAAAERLGLTAETEEVFREGRPLGTLGADPALDAAIFALKQGEVTKAPVKIGDSWVVIGVTKRTDADLAQFDKQRDQLMQSALDERRNQVFDEYVAAIRRRLEQDGEIVLHNDVLARIDSAEPPAAFPRAPIPIQPPGQ